MKKYLAIIASILLISINIEVCNAADTSPGIATTMYLTDNKTSNNQFLTTVISAFIE